MKNPHYHKLMLTLFTAVIALCCNAQLKTVYKIILDNTVYDVVYDGKGRIQELNCTAGTGAPQFTYKYQDASVKQTRWKYAKSFFENEAHWSPIYTVKYTISTSPKPKINGTTYVGEDESTHILTTHTLTRDHLTQDLTSMDATYNYTIEWKDNSLSRIRNSQYPQGDADIVVSYEKKSYTPSGYSMDWLCFVVDRICFNEDEEIFNYWQNSPFAPLAAFPSRIVNYNRDATYQFRYNTKDGVCTIQIEELRDSSKTEHTAMVFFK
jgi:hypothetical protein